MDAKWIWSKKDKKINKPTLVYFQKNVKINKNKSCSIKSRFVERKDREAESVLMIPL